MHQIRIYFECGSSVPYIFFYFVQWVLTEETQRLSLPGSGVGQHPQQLMLPSGPGMAMPTTQRTPSSPVQTISFKAEDVAITVGRKRTSDIKERRFCCHRHGTHFMFA